MKKATETFIEASDNFLIKVSDMLNTLSSKDRINVDEAKEMLDIIYRGAQYVKIMQGEKKVVEKEKKNPSSVADRMGRRE